MCKYKGRSAVKTFIFPFVRRIKRNTWMLFRCLLVCSPDFFVLKYFVRFKKKWILTLWTKSIEKQMYGILCLQNASSGILKFKSWFIRKVLFQCSGGKSFGLSWNYLQWNKIKLYIDFIILAKSLLQCCLKQSEYLVLKLCVLVSVKSGFESVWIPTIFMTGCVQNVADGNLNCQAR